VLTKRELNRALLARQLLSERVRTTIPRALERMAGIQAQYAPAMYIGLWSRLEDFARDDLTEALERRTVVQGTLLRSTIHLVAAGDWRPFALATRGPRHMLAARTQTHGLSEPELRAVAAALQERLVDGPLTRKQVEEVVGKGWLGWVGAYVDMVRIPPSGTWERRRADLFHAADTWVPPSGSGPELDLVEAEEHLIRRYLAGFGPASLGDIASWAGMTVGQIGPILDRISLRRFRDESGELLLDLPRAPLPPADTAVPVRFIATWDASLLVHARRTGILPEEYRPAIFNTKMPQSAPTFLVDGAVAGTWRYSAGRVVLEPFRSLPKAIMSQLAEEADRLTGFHA
jgi:hypothetical protein